MNRKMKTSKKKHTPKGPAPFFKPISQNGNLWTTNAREENINNLASQRTQLPTQAHVNIIITDIEEENLYIESPQADLLQWHCRLGKYLFTKLRLLSALGIMPRKLLKVKPCKCDGCLYGNTTYRPWLAKSENNRGYIRKAYAPGECISVYQMESSTPGFIAQLKCKPTKHCYRAATIFLDHNSFITYVHLQRGLLSDETIQAKKLFETYTCTYKVKVNTITKKVEYLYTPPSYRKLHKKTRRLTIVEWILKNRKTTETHQRSTRAYKKTTQPHQGWRPINL